mgnify:FL=1
MRWENGRRSDNIEDRRDDDADGYDYGSDGGGRRLGIRGGIGGVLLILVLLGLGVDPRILLNEFGNIIAQQTSAPSHQSPAPARHQQASQEDRLADFVSVVLADTEDTWSAIFRESGKTYSDPKLVLFRGATRSACGLGEAAMGPFYCPGDHKVYIDLAFYDELRNRFGAPGDFAQAYVIAHEVGHHVQNLLGISDRVAAQMRRVGQAQANALSVRQELQADCFAGIWARRADQTRKILEQGDVEEGLRAASAIGDDRLQRQARGYVTPDSFTHGTSAQRVRWFERGLQADRLSACDTFATDRL